jgi:hypothetical protein
VALSDGSVAYCCIPAPAQGSCAAGGAVAGCAFPAIGFTCTADESPDQSDPALTCSVGVQNAKGSVDYCCE